ncbi:hypothetical protein [Aeoliella straminimaris]|nr:hypothetical protein [Aeoliella straminimaris]
MHYLTRSLIAGVTVLVGCTGSQPNSINAPSKPDHLIMGEGSSISDGLSISNGNVVVIDDQPGIAFATVTPPGQSKRVAYFLVFNHDRPNARVKTEGGSSGSTANTFHTINTFGNECTVEYDVVLKDGTESIETESISISDTEYDSSKGRVFLIDMEATPPSVTQLNLDLPADVPALKEPDATKQFGQDTLNAFRKADKSVDDFCRSIEARGK